MAPDTSEYLFYPTRASDTSQYLIDSTWTYDEEGRSGTMTIEFRTKVAPELKGVMPEREVSNG